MTQPATANDPAAIAAAQAAAATTAAAAPAATELPEAFVAIAKKVGGQSEQLLKGFVEYLKSNPELTQSGLSMHQMFGDYMMDDAARMETMAVDAARVSAEMRKLALGKKDDKAMGTPEPEAPKYSALTYLAATILTAPFRLVAGATKETLKGAAAGAQMGVKAANKGLSRWRENKLIRTHDAVEASLGNLELSAERYAAPLIAPTEQEREAQRKHNLSAVADDMEVLMRNIRRNAEAVHAKAERGEISPEDAEAQSQFWLKRANAAMQQAGDSPNAKQGDDGSRLKEMSDRIEKMIERLKTMFNRLFGRENADGAAPKPQMSPG